MPRASVGEAGGVRAVAGPLGEGHREALGIEHAATRTKAAGGLISRPHVI